MESFLPGWVLETTRLCPWLTAKTMCLRPWATKRWKNFHFGWPCSRKLSLRLYFLLCIKTLRDIPVIDDDTASAPPGTIFIVTLPNISYGNPCECLINWALFRRGLGWCSPSPWNQIPPLFKIGTMIPSARSRVSIVAFINNSAVTMLVPSSVKQGNLASSSVSNLSVRFEHFSPRFI